MRDVRIWGQVEPKRTQKGQSDTPSIATGAIARRDQIKEDYAVKTLLRNSFIVMAIATGTQSLAQVPGMTGGFEASAYPIVNTLPADVPQVPTNYFSANNGTNIAQVAGQSQPGTTFQPAVFGAAQITAPPAVAAPHTQQTSPEPVPIPQSDSAAHPGAAAPAAPYCASCGANPISGGWPPTPRFGGPVWGNWPSGVYGAAAGYTTNWFGGANALVFQRIDNKNRPLAFYDNSFTADTLGTQSARQSVAGGVEATVGRYFNCGRNAVVLNYWGLFPSDEQVTFASSMPGDFRSRIPFNYMMMPGTPSNPNTPYSVYDWYDNAYTHMLRRSFEYHNVEVNLLGFALGGAARQFTRPAAACTSCGGAGCASCARRGVTGPCSLIGPACGSRLNVSWLAGFRYFRFQENLLFAASLDDTVVNRSNDDLYYEVDTTNDLYGFQLGSQINYCISCRWSVYSGVKAGIYGNHSRLYTRLGTDYDDAYLDDPRMPTNPDNGMTYRCNKTKDDVAFLSELTAGATYRFTPALSAMFGYRAVIAAGVATAPDNVRYNFDNFRDIEDFDNRGTLVLHGFTFGGAYNF